MARHPALSEDHGHYVAGPPALSQDNGHHVVCPRRAVLGSRLPRGLFPRCSKITAKTLSVHAALFPDHGHHVVGLPAMSQNHGHHVVCLPALSRITATTWSINPRAVPGSFMSDFPIPR